MDMESRERESERERERERVHIGMRKPTRSQGSASAAASSALRQLQSLQWILTRRWLQMVGADGGAPAVLALAPLTVMRADAGVPAALAPAPDAVMLTDTRAPAVLALAPLAVMLAPAAPPMRCSQRAGAPRTAAPHTGQSWARAVGSALPPGWRVRAGCACTSQLGQLRMATVGRSREEFVDQTAVDPGVRQCTLSQKTSSICCGEAAATG